MAERIVSPGVFTNEKDQSFLQRGVSEIGAAIIGTTIKGPASIPTQVNSFTDFIETFGSYGDSYVPFTVQEYLKNAGVVTVTRLLYKGGYKLTDGILAIIASSGSAEYVTHVLHPTNPVATTGDTSVFEKSEIVDGNNGNFTLWVTGSYTNDLDVPGFSGAYLATGSIETSIFTGTSKYIGNVFGYSPESVDFPVYVQYENENAAALFNNAADVKLRLGIINYENVTDGDNGFASTPFITSQKVGSTQFNLFKFHTLSHGNGENYEVKVGIRDIRLGSEISDPNGYGTFTVEVRGVNNTDIPNSPFDSTDTDLQPDILETFRNCNLDPNSANYIGRKIGDQVRTISDEGKIIDKGDFSPVSKYIRVEVADGVKRGTYQNSLIPFGFKAPFSPIPDGEESSGNVKPDLTLSSFTGGTGGTAGTYVVTPTTNGTGTGLDLSVTTSNSAGKLKTGAIAVGVNIGDGVDATYNNVDLSDGTGTGAQATVEVVSNAVTSVTVSAIGSGYQSGDVLKIAAGLLGGGSSEVTLAALTSAELLVEPTLVKTVGIGSGYTSGNTLTVALGDIGTASGNLVVTLQPSEVQNLDQGMLEVKYRTSQFINNSYNGNNYFGFDYTDVSNLNYLAPIPTTGPTVALNTDFYLGDMSQDSSANFPSATNQYTGTLESSLEAGTFSTKVKSSTRKFMIPFQGGFDGARPNLPKFSGGDIKSKNTFGFDCSTPDSTGTKAYRSAFAALSNTDFFDINMLITPGILHSIHPSVTNDARTLVEERSDTFYVMDVPELTDSIDTTINNVLSLDSNYTATYYPWVRIVNPSNNNQLYVPPSVLVPGALSFNDSVSAPWYAPAGLNRGGLTTAINTYEKLTQSDRDDLYEARINPIANFPNQGICIWGQKTLQARASALDRVNVRRLLITVKKFIASATKFLVFEQNTDATRLRFLSIANPYLESVRAQQGLSAFRVVMDDSNNTPDLIDQNILYGQIFLQPTRTAEFIVLDFNIQPTGASFPE